MAFAVLAPGAHAAREQLSLDQGWRFHLGDIPFPVIKGHQPSYDNAKAGASYGAAASDFDDSEWRKLNLPHDWAVEQPFDPNANLAQGFRQRGIGWYRREFRLDPSDRGKHIEVQLDGVSTHCTVWVNGILVHRNWCGYTSFYIDITPSAKYGNDTNVISVRVDANAMEGWWYEGAGIYRHTWLVKRSPIHIMTDGVYANPVRNADGTWTIPSEITLNSSAKEKGGVTVESTLLDPSGAVVASATSDAQIAPFETVTARNTINVESPRLWSVDDPALYTVKTVLKQSDAVIDEVVTRCGFRTIRFDADKGFFLNDQPLKLKGTCNHQDHAGVGVAMPDSLWEFRLRKLKEMGSNAYRCAHNPPAKEFLELCDRMGMLVMDENRNFGTSPEHMRQLEWLIRRDRNHPSVILWSVFNEEPFQGSEMGYEMVRRMSAAVKVLDTTRPVTAAQSAAMLSRVNASLAADVGGFNYRHNEYDRYHQMHPDKPITSSEDTSAVMTRGNYVTDKKTAFVLDSYDLQWQNWGRSHREAWKLIDERPFLAGGFVWTGFDYRGEPQPLEWPATGSSFGIMDLCGFPKSAFYIHQAHWIKDKPILHLIPHWNWAGSEGKPIKVMPITNAEEVELLLNGNSLGKKPVDPYMMVTFNVNYEPGKLEVVGYRAGAEIARTSVETTGDPVALQLIPDRSAINADGADAMPVTVQAIDAMGRPVPTANLPVWFQVEGSGEIIGLGNGNPIAHEAEKGDRQSLFNGLAQVIVRSSREPGKLTLRALAQGLAPAQVEIQAVPAPVTPEVPAPSSVFVIGRWRMSPFTQSKPDPNQQVSRNDMNSWTNINPGRLQAFNDGKYALYRATLRPRASVRKNGGKVTFPDVVGAAEVWIDGKLAMEKSEPQKQTLTVPLAPTDVDHVVSVVIESPGAGEQAGLGGTVIVEANPTASTTSPATESPPTAIPR